MCCLIDKLCNASRLKFKYNPIVVISYLLNLLGLCTFKDKWRFKVTSVFSIAFMNFMYLNDLSLITLKFAKGELSMFNDFEILTFMQTQGITVYRMFLLIKYKDKFKSLVRFVTRDCLSWTYQSNDITKKLEQSFAKGSLIFKLQVIQMTIIAIMAISRPILSTKTSALAMQEPLGQLYFINSYKAPFYQITYFAQEIYLLIAICMAFCMNMLYLTLLIRACGFLEYLAVDLESIGYNGDIKNDEVHKAVQDFVNRYNKIREFVNLFNELFSTVTAVLPLYVGFSIITSLLVFDGTGQSILFFSIAVGHVVELYIYCYTGDLIAEKSSELGDRIFAGRWYEFSTRDKKSILQILQQCNRPFNIKAGFFGIFSMNMFTATMKTTYSIWAVINQAR